MKSGTEDLDSPKRERERESKKRVQRKKTWALTEQEDPSSSDSHPKKEDPSLKLSKERVLRRPIPHPHRPIPLCQPIPHCHQPNERPTPKPIEPP